MKSRTRTSRTIKHKSNNNNNNNNNTDNTDNTDKDDDDDDDDDDLDDDLDMDMESETRELYLLILKSYANESLDELTMMEQEIVMLNMMKSMSEQQMIKGGPNSNSNSNGGFSSSSNSRRNDNSSSSSRSSAFSDANDPDGLARANLAHIPLLPPLEGIDTSSSSSPGIHITRTAKGIDGQIIMNKDIIKANVFVPSMSGPTMSLAEFGDLEKEKAIQRDIASKESAELNKGEDTLNTTRRYSQLHADGDEDINHLVDHATIADREWDQFKEENPKGWGNKAGKRF
jgi:hypothetical protein